jgi:hypothetical protein
MVRNRRGLGVGRMRIEIFGFCRLCVRGPQASHKLAGLAQPCL